MIPFLQLPCRHSVATAHALGQATQLQVLPPVAVRPSTRRPRTVLAYLRLIGFRTPRELGPRMVGIALSLILACQVALVFWLSWGLRRP